jgi:hypothetical protein
MIAPSIALGLADLLRLAERTDGLASQAREHDHSLGLGVPLAGRSSAFNSV